MSTTNPVAPFFEGRLYFLAPGFIGPLKAGQHRAGERVQRGWVWQLAGYSKREVRRRVLVGRIGRAAYKARWQLRRARSFALNTLARAA